MMPGTSPMKLTFVSRPIAVTTPIAVASLGVWVHRAGHEPEQWRQRDSQAADGPGPRRPREGFADEQVDKQRGEPRHQRGQQSRELQAVEQRAARAQKVGDRLERV